MRSHFLKQMLVVVLGCSMFSDAKADWVEDMLYDQIADQNLQQFQELGEELGQRHADVAMFNLNIRDARRAFWQTFPNDPGHGEAKARLAELLYEKDMQIFAGDFLFGEKKDVNRLMNAVIGTGKTLDNGVPEFARRHFDFWLRSVRQKMMELNGMRQGKVAQIGQMFTLGLHVKPALIACEDKYRFYQSRRDWYEFYLAGHEADYYVSPAGFLKFWAEERHRSRSESELSDQDVARSLEAMVQLYGAELVVDCVKVLIAAPKKEPGVLKDPDLLHLPPNNGHMTLALRELLAAASPRSALISTLWELNLDTKADGDFRAIRQQLPALEYIYGADALRLISVELQSPKIRSNKNSSRDSSYVDWRYTIDDDLFKARADIFAARLERTPYRPQLSPDVVEKLKAHHPSTTQLQMPKSRGDQLEENSGGGKSSKTSGKGGRGGRGSRAQVSPEQREAVRQRMLEQQAKLNDSQRKNGIYPRSWIIAQLQSIPQVATATETRPDPESALIFQPLSSVTKKEDSAVEVHPKVKIRSRFGETTSATPSRTETDQTEKQNLVGEHSTQVTESVPSQSESRPTQSDTSTDSGQVDARKPTREFPHQNSPDTSAATAAVAMQSHSAVGRPVTPPQIPLFPSATAPVHVPITGAPRGGKYTGTAIGTILITIILACVVGYCLWRPSIRQLLVQQGTSLAGKVTAKSLKTAKGMVDAAKLKKLQIYDLANADHAIGLKAIREKVGLRELHEKIDALRQLEQQIQEKKKALPIDEYATLQVRFEHATNEARQKVEMEHLRLKRAKLITKIGTTIRGSAELSRHPAVTEEIKAAERIIAQVEQISRPVS